MKNDRFGQGEYLRGLSRRPKKALGKANCDLFGWPEIHSPPLFLTHARAEPTNWRNKVSLYRVGGLHQPVR